jgi:flagellar biosynthesis/type III secretory pathway protein FliH
MFSEKQKRIIAAGIQQILRDTGDPELPTGEIRFSIHVEGEEPWDWADIENNGAVTNPDVNPWNESQDAIAKAMKHDLEQASIWVQRSQQKNLADEFARIRASGFAEGKRAGRASFAQDTLDALSAITSEGQA